MNLTEKLILASSFAVILTQTTGQYERRQI